MYLVRWYALHGGTSAYAFIITQLRPRLVFDDGPPSDPTKLRPARGYVTALLSLTGR